MSQMPSGGGGGGGGKSHHKRKKKSTGENVTDTIRKQAQEAVKRQV